MKQNNKILSVWVVILAYITAITASYNNKLFSVRSGNVGHYPSQLNQKELKMNKKIVIAMLFAVVLMSVGFANAQKDVKYVYPKTSFDKEATQKALEKGKSTIRGSAFTKDFTRSDAGGKKTGQTAGAIVGMKAGGGMKGVIGGAVAGEVAGEVAEKEAAKKLGSKKFATKGSLVTLFPLTSYFEEYMQMRSKSESIFNAGKLNPFGKKKVPAVSEEAYEYKITTTVLDDKGNFEFKNLKPGRYLLEARIIYVKESTAAEQIGTETYETRMGGPNGPLVGYNQVPIYEYYTVYWNKEAYVNKEVQIAEDGSVITIELR